MQQQCSKPLCTDEASFESTCHILFFTKLMQEIFKCIKLENGIQEYVAKLPYFIATLNLYLILRLNYIKGKCGRSKGRLQLYLILCVHCVHCIINQLLECLISYFNWKIVFSNIFCNRSTEQDYRSTAVPRKKLKMSLKMSVTYEKMSSSVSKY